MCLCGCVICRLGLGVVWIRFVFYFESDVCFRDLDLWVVQKCGVKMHSYVTEPFGVGTYSQATRSIAGGWSKKMAVRRSRSCVRLNLFLLLYHFWRCFCTLFCFSFLRWLNVNK